MITFSNLGRHGEFGNQLFQIAATIGYARKCEQQEIILFLVLLQQMVVDTEVLTLEQILEVVEVLVEEEQTVLEVV